MMYRKALKQIPSGCKALEQTLLEFKKKPSAFYTCACCESEASEVKLRDLHKNANQVLLKLLNKFNLFLNCSIVI